MKLEAQEVERIFTDSLFKEGEDTSTAVMAEGIMTKAGFNPVRLETHRAEISALLDELPETFRQSSGGGWSFLQMVEDRHGNLWTGEHQIAEYLLLLGIATGRVKIQLPREVWDALPGGMPYFVILDATEGARA